MRKPRVLVRGIFVWRRLVEGQRRQRVTADAVARGARLVGRPRVRLELGRGRRRVSSWTTVFEKVPEYFVERYDRELVEWGRRFREIGRERVIVLREGVLAEACPDEEMGASLIGVRLECEVDWVREKVVVRPVTERDEELIRKHCEKLIAAGIPSRGVIEEPVRPGLPVRPVRRVV